MGITKRKLVKRRQVGCWFRPPTFSRDPLSASSCSGGAQGQANHAAIHPRHHHRSQSSPIPCLVPVTPANLQAVKWYNAAVARSRRRCLPRRRRRGSTPAKPATAQPQRSPDDDLHAKCERLAPMAARQISCADAVGFRGRHLYLSGRRRTVELQYCVHDIETVQPQLANRRGAIQVAYKGSRVAFAAVDAGCVLTGNGRRQTCAVYLPLLRLFD